MAERRSHLRKLDCELIKISWQEDSANHIQVGDVNDVSLSGVGITVDHPIPVGTPVTIHYDSLFDQPLSGIVRHHSEHPNGHSLGIEFTSESKDAKVHFHPELFTNITPQAPTLIEPQRELGDPSERR